MIFESDNVGMAASSVVASHFWLIILEGMHQFHLNLTEGSSIIKHRTTLKTGVIRNILTELWPLLAFSLDKLSICGFWSIIFEGMIQFLSNFTEG